MSCRIDSLLSPHLFGVWSVCIRLHPFASVCIHFQSGPGPVHNFYSTCLRSLVILRFSNLLAGPMVHTMLFLGAITGQKSVQKEAKTGVPATNGKKWFQYVICYVSAMSGTSTQSHFCGNSGCQSGVRTKVKKNIASRYTLEAQVVTLRPQVVISGSHFGSLLEPRS